MPPRVLVPFSMRSAMTKRIRSAVLFADPETRRQMLEDKDCPASKAICKLDELVWEVGYPQDEFCL